MSKEGTIVLLEQIVDLLNDYGIEENEIRDQIKQHKGEIKMQLAEKKFKVMNFDEFVDKYNAEVGYDDLDDIADSLENADYRVAYISYNGADVLEEYEIYLNDEAGLKCELVNVTDNKRSIYIAMRNIA